MSGSVGKKAVTVHPPRRHVRTQQVRTHAHIDGVAVAREAQQLGGVDAVADHDRERAEVPTMQPSKRK